MDCDRDPAAVGIAPVGPEGAVVDLRNLLVGLVDKVLCLDQVFELSAGLVGADATAVVRGSKRRANLRRGDRLRLKSEPCERNGQFVGVPVVLDSVVEAYPRLAGVGVDARFEVVVDTAENLRLPISSLSPSIIRDSILSDVPGIPSLKHRESTGWPATGRSSSASSRKVRRAPHGGRHS